MKKIPLTQGKFALVDDKDFAHLSSFKWCAQKGRYTFYAVRRSRACEGAPSRLILMHRQILGCRTGDFADHEDENGLNNCRSNLRVATHAQNLRNRGKQKNNTSGFKCVYFDRRKNVFQAYITVDGIRTTLGVFKTPEKAHAVYCAAAKKLHRKFARFA